jgi:hypothetical protein
MPLARARNPPVYQLAHLNVEIPFEVLFDVDKLADMGPTQLRTQCVRNLRFALDCSKLDTVVKLPLAPASAEFLGQVLRQAGYDLFSIGRSIGTLASD